MKLINLFDWLIIACALVLLCLNPAAKYTHALILILSCVVIVFGIASIAIKYHMAKRLIKKADMDKLKDEFMAMKEAAEEYRRTVDEYINALEKRIP